MDADEGEIAREWLTIHGREYHSVRFNVRLGHGRPPASDDDESTRRMWKAITQVRADFVAYRSNAVDVVEAKMHARVDAVTQVRNYAALFAGDYPTWLIVRPVVICRAYDEAAAIVLADCGGLLECFPSAAMRV